MGVIGVQRKVILGRTGASAGRSRSSAASLRESLFGRRLRRRAPYDFSNADNRVDPSPNHVPMS